MKVVTRKAFVLAAGFGSRLEPITHVIPKPLVPLWGRPLISHTLLSLARWGVRDVVINSHHGADSLIRFLNDRHNVPTGMRVTVSFEPDVLGTGGALRKAGCFAGSDPFWLVNSDIAFDLNPSLITERFLCDSPLAALWLADHTGPRTVTATHGWITGFHAARPKDPETFTFCGLHLLSPAIMNLIPPGPSSIISVYENAMAKGFRLAGVTVPGAFWADLGTPESYISAHRDIIFSARNGLPGGRLAAGARISHTRSLSRKQVTITGFAHIGNNTAILPGSTIRDSVIGNNVTILPGSTLSNAIVMDNLVVQGIVDRVAAPFVPGTDRAVSSALEHLRWPVDGTVLLPMAPRGSARSYTRIRRGSRTVILMKYSRERVENALYAGISRFLSSMRFPVPKLIADFDSLNACVAEDVGDLCLTELIRAASPPAQTRIYRQVLRHVARLHGVISRTAQRNRHLFMPPFSAKLFDWEHDLFAEHMLTAYCRLPPARIDRIMRELRSITRPLRRERHVLIHRDLQSSNILLHRGICRFIDFQGMRFGPAMYDVASLLCDPYVELTPEVRRDLLLAYAQFAGISPHGIEESFRVAAVQRLVQALGAFGRLGLREPTRRFRKHIIPAFRVLDHMLRDAQDVPEFSAFTREMANTGGNL